MALATSSIIGWDVLCAAFMLSVLATMMAHAPDQIRVKAAQQDEGKGLILTLVLTAATVSLFAIAAQLSLAKAEHGLMRIGHVALAFTTVAASWLMVQLIFAFHYAHEYYAQKPGGGDEEGLKFPGGEPPDYWDFIHFSVVIGAAAQTADIEFTSKTLRRIGTVHCLVSFAYNTVIVALTINLLAGLF
jgi:uncharacterized membrane protein